MKKQKKGSALLLTTILLFVVLSMVVSLSYVTVMEQQMSSKTKSSVGSFFNADSGVEWALNKIANGSGGKIATVFEKFNQGECATNGSCTPCPFGGCKVYFLDETGKVITDGSTNDVSAIKAVRSVGTQETGEVTQRAIEAAVASGGGGCYVDYSLDSGLTADSSCKVSGFKVKGSAGMYGNCIKSGAAYFLPPGGKCYGDWTKQDAGEAYVCCL